MAPSLLPPADRSASYIWDSSFDLLQERMFLQSLNETLEDVLNKGWRNAAPQGLSNPNDNHEQEGDDESDTDDNDSNCGCIEEHIVRKFARWEVSDSLDSCDRREKMEGFCRDLAARNNATALTGRNQRERKGKLAAFVYDGDKSGRNRPLAHQELLEKLSRKASETNAELKAGLLTIQ